jgi:hypothetical protein
MKKLILLLALAFAMCGCDCDVEQLNYNMSSDGFILKEIDSCEYFMVHISSYSDGGCYLPVHKQNCKYCAERRKKEQEELIRKIKGQ